MFTPEPLINSIQLFRKTLVNQMISEPSLNKLANAYIDMQTEFAKNLVNATYEFYKYSADAAAGTIYTKSAKK
jgi:hypothetical protein